MGEPRAGVIGATSLVGRCVLEALAQKAYKIDCFSRKPVVADGALTWHVLGAPERQASEISFWLCLAPIWVLPEHFDLMERHGARHVVALSSTSRYTKDASSDSSEQLVARRLAESEEQLRIWAESRGIAWTVLRPTLIYGHGADKNISEMARFIRRFGFFPILGKGQGLRQPVHAEDVASACVAALEAGQARDRAFNLSGGEALPYREMVNRVFVAMGRRPRMLTVPLAVFRLAVACMRVIPRYRHWSASMAERMNQDLVFDHRDAALVLGFKPRKFAPGHKEIPR